MTDTVQREKRKMIWLAGLIELFLGFETGGIEIALLLIAAEFSINHTTMGSIVTIQSLACAFVPLILGHVADRRGKKKYLTIFFFVLIGGCVLIMASQSYAVLAIGLVVIGAGYGMTECIGTAALSDTDLDRAERNVSVSQAVYSFGAVIGPLICTWLIRVTGNWRVVFAATGVEFLALLFLLVRVHFEKSAEQGKPSVQSESTKDAEAAGTASEKPSLWKVLASVTLLVSVILIFFYTGLETGSASFADAYFTKVIGDASRSAVALSGFWLAMAVSRFAFGFIKWPARFVVPGAYAISAMILYLLLAVRAAIPAMVLFVAAGLFLGPIWPLLIGMTTRRFPEDTGAVAGILMAASGLGSGLMPIFMGMMSDAFGVRASYWLPAITATCGCVLYLLADRKGHMH